MSNTNVDGAESPCEEGMAAGRRLAEEGVMTVWNLSGDSSRGATLGLPAGRLLGWLTLGDIRDRLLNRSGVVQRQRHTMV